MIQFILNHESYTAPELDELTIDQFVGIIDGKSDYDRLNSWFDFPKELPGTDRSEKEVSSLIKLLDAMVKEANVYLTNPIEPKDIIVMSTGVKFTKDLGKLPYWALTKVKDCIKAMGKQPFNKYDHYKTLVGHYIYTKVTGKEYNEYSAEQFIEDVVSQMNRKEVLSLGDFFLYMQHHLWMPKKDYLKVNVQLKKLKLASMFSISTAN